MINAPATTSATSSRSSRASIALRHPSRERRDDRHPRGRRGGRHLAAPARLKAAGASGILVLPIEKIVP